MGNSGCKSSAEAMRQLQIAKTLQAALLNLISGAVLAGSTHVGEFIAFRFVAGAGAFSILAAVPVSPPTLGKREIGLME
jgi:hypothetical protein